MDNLKLKRTHLVLVLLVLEVAESGYSVHGPVWFSPWLLLHILLFDNYVITFQISIAMTVLSSYLVYD